MTTVAKAYWGYAQLAANQLVGGTASPDVARWILAQWICESGWDYPPDRNNPGSLTLGWAAATGLPFTLYGTGIPPAGYAYVGPDPYTGDGENPQQTRGGDPGDNPIVTFADVATGVRAYYTGLLVIREVGALKYADALVAARSGDGRTFVADALREHYGTSMACCDSVNAILLPKQGLTDQGDAMFSTGSADAITARYRYPIVTGTRLYAGTDETKFLKAFAGAPGNARFMGPSLVLWSAATWTWGVVLIGTSAFDEAGTGLYVKVTKGKQIDTRKLTQLPDGGARTAHGHEPFDPDLADAIARFPG